MLRNDSGIQKGQSQEYGFSLQFWTPGVGVFIGTTDNKTKLDWVLNGTLGVVATSTTKSASPSPSSTNGSAGGQQSQGRGHSLSLELFWVMLPVLLILMML
jgi:hypothetical protein